jgi:ferritin-like metal-binding protein YciE
MDDPQSLEPMAVLKRAVVAGESVAFIAGQYQSLRQHFEAHIPASRRAYVDQFFSKVIDHSNSYICFSICICSKTPRRLSASTPDKIMVDFSLSAVSFENMEHRVTFSIVQFTFGWF